jgi:hypothetical protein
MELLLPWAEAIVQDLTEGGVRLVDYQPGNGTRYGVVLTHVGAPFTAEHRERAGLFGGSQTILTMPLLNRCAVLPASGTIDYPMLMSRMGCTESTAVIVAELVAHLLGRKPLITYAAWAAKTAPADHVVQETPAPLMVECGSCHQKDAIPAADVLAARPGEDITFQLRHACTGCGTSNLFAIDLTDFEV